MKPAANPDPLAQLTEIRAIMERSSRFLSLSGLSGVGAGVVGLLGAAVGHFYLQDHYPAGYIHLINGSEAERWSALPFLLLLAGVVLGGALLLALYFTWRRTHRHGQQLWNSITKRLFVALALPLVTGGLFCLRLYLGGDAGMVVPGMLVFYGLALLNASKYTLDEIRWLGLTQIVLGLVAMLLPGWGLIFFALGFGLGHIGYGLLMYNRYERAETAA
jgi:MFS family permease